MASRRPLREYGTTPDFAAAGLGYKKQISLRNMYLNGVGIGEAACKAIAEYLMWPGCPTESLYLSNNPFGDAGAIALARGLAVNKSLRVSLASCCVNINGARAILEALQGHPRLQSLNMSQSNPTKDLETRYNYLGDDVIDALEIFFTSGPQTLRPLELGTTGMTLPAICSVVENVLRSDSLVLFTLKSVHGQIIPEINTLVNDHMKRKIQRLYNFNVTTFEAQEKRWLRSPKDVRFNDSMSHNRDVGLALRGKKTL
ncbi:hypothetical protein ABVK25_003866 [Lepraria finkii]|uniref:Uncharacterized protein n=1 Tax=Lepraria finkii TaxID=1340010 RepID=A0ABR4BFQ9_9LECA